MKEIFINDFKEAQKVLDSFINKSENFEKLQTAGLLLVEAFKSGKKVISCGNGGSMCDAMHLAEELTGRFRDDRPSLPAIAISDSSHLTCAANDYGFESIYSRFIEGIGNKGDILFAISTSGNSVNIINAAKKAKEKGLKVIGLTGKNGGKLGEIADVEIRVPHMGYSDRIQEIHIKIIHSLINYIEKNL